MSGWGRYGKTVHINKPELWSITSIEWQRTAPRQITSIKTCQSGVQFCRNKHSQQQLSAPLLWTKQTKTQTKSNKNSEKLNLWRQFSALHSVRKRLCTVACNSPTWSLQVAISNATLMYLPKQSFQGWG